MQRRWTSMAGRDFGAVHNIISTLVLNCDMAPHRTVGMYLYTII